MRRLLILLLVLILPAAGCIYYNTAPGQQVGQGSRPSIVAFSAVPSSIASGGQSTLVWNVTNSTSVSIDQGIGAVNAAGTTVVSPSSTIIYTLTASNSNGSSTATAEVTVNGQSQMGLPVITQYYARPSTINPGDSSTIYWDVSNATDVIITNIGDVNLSGNKDVYPLGTTIYTLKAKNDVGTSTAFLLVTVGTSTYGATGGQNGAPLIQEFRVTPDVIRPGDTALLSWRVDGASSVYIWQIGNVPATGSQAVNPTVTTGYVITATNSYGTTTSNALLTVD